MLRVLSLGAGVQSTTVLLMSCRGVLPKLDAAVFADTQWEPKAVYTHLEWLIATAARHGIEVLKGTRGDLRADAIRKTGGKASGDPEYKRWASMPLYVLNPDGSIGIINRQCTSEYKIEVVERIVRRDLLGLKPRQVAPANAVEHWFGISADETQRMRKSPNHWQTFRYPLVHDVNSPRKDTLFGRGYDRQDCKEWLRDKVPHEVPRSACIGCPYHSDEEWLRLKTEAPEEWADAVAFDNEIRAASAAQAEGKVGRLVGLPYLHRSCVPLDQVVFDGRAVKVQMVVDSDDGSKGPRVPLTLTDSGMGNECMGMCGV